MSEVNNQAIDKDNLVKEKDEVKTSIDAHIAEEKKRSLTHQKLICKLGTAMTDRIGHKVTTDDPEYYGLSAMVSDEMARVALKMPTRKHLTIEQISKRTKKSVEELKPLLYDMGYVGIIEWDYVGEEKKQMFYRPTFVPGTAEWTNSHMEDMKAHPEVTRFFDRMTFLPLEKVVPMVPPGGAGIGMHVIPVEKAIDAKSESLDLEHISHWLKKYDGHLAALPCSCRMERRLMGEGSPEDYEDWCLAAGHLSDYMIETKKGHYITYEQAMDILQKAEKMGFVHQITNIDGKDKIFGICNCNPAICNALRTSQLFNTPNLSRSAYVARVETKNCVACGECVKYCPAGAVKLGQKLCTKEGPVVYPKHPLPDAQKWGEKDWDVNYRDNNRINCYSTGTAPCKTACPAHIAIQGYLKLAGEGRYQDALALIKKNNPFPAICGRICNRRCESECTRGTIDKAIAIDAVKRFIAEQDLKAETRYVPEILPTSLRGRMKEKIAIIGAGPAGLSCAYYLALEGYYPTVFEKEKEPGGMMRYGIPSYKLEKELIAAEISILKDMGVTIKCGVEVGKDVTLASLRKEGYKGFYLAIGCQEGRYPGIPGEKGEGCMSALSFLHDVNSGHKETMEGDVVVIGGGNVAIDAARVSTRLTKGHVLMFSLESLSEMPASPLEQNEAKDEGVEIINSWGPKEVIREKGKVTAIILKKCVSVFDKDHHFKPVYDETVTKEAKCSHVIFAVGQGINWGHLLDGEKVNFWHGNYPLADKLTFQTSQDDIFVGGDVYTGPKFVIDAIAEGKEGAISLHRFVQPNASLTIGRNRNDFIALNKKDIVIESYDNSSRVEEHLDPKIDEKKSWKDARLTMTEAEVKRETSRCLSCGASVVDENKCIGCGVCTTKCNFDAIHLFRERPECSNLVPVEERMKAVIPYALKRQVKIIFHKKSKDA